MTSWLEKLPWFHSTLNVSKNMEVLKQVFLVYPHAFALFTLLIPLLLIRKILGLMGESVRYIILLVVLYLDCAESSIALIIL